MDADFAKWKQDNADEPGGTRANPLPGLSPLDYGGGGSNVAAKDVSGDAVDKAIDRLTKHTKQQEADTLAVGLGDAALAKFRAESAETAAVLANHGKETDDQRERFAKLKDEASAAAD